MTETPPEPPGPRGDEGSHRTGSIPLGRWAGIAFRLDPLLLAVVGLVALVGHRRGDVAGTLLLLGIALVSVALHEVAHAWKARRLGLAVSAIVLHVVPVTWTERGTAADEWRVALAGPAANLLLVPPLAAALLLAGRVPEPSLEPILADPLAFALAINLAIGALNLLPLLPVDGGRALGAWLRSRGRPRAARAVLLSTGLAAGSLLLLGALLLWTLPESLYLALLALVAIAFAVAQWRRGS